MVLFLRENLTEDFALLLFYRNIFVVSYISSEIHRFLTIPKAFSEYPDIELFAGYLSLLSKHLHELRAI